jgi:hypothetical protein
MVGNKKGAAKEMTTPTPELGAKPRYNSRLIQRKRELLLALPPFLG